PASRKPPAITAPLSLSRLLSYGCGNCPHGLGAGTKKDNEMNHANDNSYPNELYEDVFIEAIAEMEQALDEMQAARVQPLTATERAVLFGAGNAASSLYDAAFAIASGKPVTDAEVSSRLESAVQQMRSAFCLAKTGSR
ncbi:hypothetical protein, partial [Mesorhizobium sp. M1322]|uniref:hypothetical protein n=1 Tax=Mesorhizobium sp. M1322 TaxID=2957081 RepID=UPI003339DD86